MAATLVPGLERRLKAEIAGEVEFDRFTRGRYATDASHYQMMPLGVVVPRTIAEAERAIAIARAGGRERAAARRRHLAERADRQRFAGHRLLEIPQPRSRARRARAAAAWSSPASCSTISTGGSSRTACGSRSTSRPPRAPPSAAWRATIPAARARCATARCATTCCRSTPCWPTARRRISARWRRTSPTCRRSLRPLAADLLGARRARGGRDRGALPQGAAPGRRLQSRCAAARPQRPQSRPHPGRLGRHARLLHPHRAEAVAAARPARRRRLPFRPFLRGDGRGPAHRQARRRSRSSWSTAP